MKPLLEKTAILTVMIFCLSMTSSVPAGSSNLPADDVWITFCLIHSDPGEDLDECLRLGGVYSTQDPDDGNTGKFIVAKENSRQNYLSLISRIQGATIDSFKQSSKHFEFVEACGIHFSSGEHPTSIRCHVTNESLGAFNPDVVLSVSWDKLIWNAVGNFVENGNPAVCAVTFDLDQIPADPETNAQQVVEEFNQSPSCSSAGLSAVHTVAPAGTFVDIYFSPQGTGEMSIPGPSSIGTLTY